MDLSIIIPIKDERDNLVRLHECLTNALLPLRCTYEILLVDDGSSDGSDRILDDLAHRDPALKVVTLRRNFGQSAALQAGIDHSSGDVILTLDGDLQNDPADIPMLLDRLAEGYDGVFGLRANRQDHYWIRKFPSQIANWIIRKVTGSTIKDMGCTIRAIRRDLATSLNLYGEMHRFIPVIAQHQGAKLLQVPVQHHARVAGKTKYNLTRTFRVVLDLITVQFLHSYLTRPMHVMGFAGLCSMGLGAICLFLAVVMKYTIGPGMTANPLFLLGVMLEVISVQFISLGLIGELMSRTYFESQGKKSYAVRTTRNFAPRKAA